MIDDFKKSFSRCISHFLICFFNVHLLAYLISFKGVFTQGFLGALTFFSTLSSAVPYAVSFV